MYLHIGSGETLCCDDIVGIFDLDTATVSHTTRKYLSKREEQGEVEVHGSDLPKSFIVMKKGCRTRVRLLKISSSALRSRINAANEATKPNLHKYQ